MSGPDHDAAAAVGAGGDTRAVVGEADVVPVAAVPGGGLAIRDGKHPDAAVVTCSRRAWNALARALMVGDHLVRR